MNKKINISIVGTGLMGLQHIKAISKSKKATLHSIVDISKNAVNLSKKYNSPFCSNWNRVGKSDLNVFKATSWEMVMSLKKSWI